MEITSPSEIIKSRILVYEIELDLRGWKPTLTTDVPGFREALLGSLPSLEDHPCMTGKKGGFSLEVGQGTDFAHVIEHVLLELIHLADAEKQIYSGWTRRKKEGIYEIHYAAPDLLTGRLAAILALDLVKRLIRGEKAEAALHLKVLKDPLSYFTQEGRMAEFKELWPFAS